MNLDTRYNDIFLYFKEDGHKYTDTLGNEYKSVTTLIGDYAPKFDKHYWLRKKSKELGITEKELEKQWQTITDEACTRGTNTHNNIEDSIKDISMFNQAVCYLKSVETGRCITIADIRDINVKPLDVNLFKEKTNGKYPEIYTVFDYYINNGYTIFSEIGAFLIDYLVSGTIDILCIKDDRFVILDWKTNRGGLQFENGYYVKDKSTKPAQMTNEWVAKHETMLPPVSHLEECNGIHYTLQLSLYARMVEMILGIPNVGLALCHIGTPFILNDYGQPRRFEDGLYHVDETGVETVNWYKIPYLKYEADVILKDRLNKLKNKPSTQLKLNF